MAKRKYHQGRKLYQQQRYFDCLEHISDALGCFDTQELPNANLKFNQPSVYKIFKDCYMLMASSYIGME